MPKAILLAALLVAVVLLTGCGGTGTAPTTSFNASTDARYTEHQVADLAGFTPTDDGIAWDYVITPGVAGCQIDVIMTTRPAVKIYADAGDAVVTNPRGDVGVKFSPDPGCREELLEALRKVR